MTDDEIIKMAIEKAHFEGGYDWRKPGVGVAHLGKVYYIDHVWCAWETIVYSHEFAKAFWGEDRGYVCMNSSHCDCEGWHKADNDGANSNSFGWYPRWVFHLERIVMQEEPLKYLLKFL